MATSVVLLLLLAGGQPVAAAPTTDQSATAPATQASGRRICRQQERLGTILPRRVCRSAAEWAVIDAEQARISERDVAHMRNHGRGSLNDGTGP